MFIIMHSSKCNFAFILFHPICSTVTDFDCIPHVNPRIENRGLAMVFDPTGSTLSWNLTLVKLKEHDVFFNAPDWYFHYGTNTIGTRREPVQPAVLTGPLGQPPVHVQRHLQLHPHPGVDAGPPGGLPWGGGGGGGGGGHRIRAPLPEYCWSTSGRWPIYYCIPEYTDKFFMWCVSIRVQSCILF